MPQKLIDITGQRFGRLTVESYDRTGKSGSLWNCRCDCGNTAQFQGSNLRRGKTVSCGCYREELRQRRGKDSPNTGQRIGPSHHNWSGGRYYNKDGYVHVSFRHSFPDIAAMYPGRYTLPEHTLVMSRLLGRAIRSDESVHHKNGQRDDNRPENLELWCSNHPSGQRVQDLLAWAKDICARYEHEAETS